MQAVFLCDKNHRNRDRAKKKKKKLSAPQSKYCGGCRIIENAGLVYFALILSGMFRVSQIEKL